MVDKKIKTFEEFASNHKSNNTCLIYSEYFDILQEYNLEDVGLLFLSILYYIKTKNIFDHIKNRVVIYAIFKMMKQRIDFDTKKYKETCYKNYLSVSKGRYNKGNDDFDNSE